MRTEKIVENRSCYRCQEYYSISDSDLEFYSKLDVPMPTHCPECREVRRLTFHNERKLYRRRCDGTGEQIISNFSPDKPHPVYRQSYWWSDHWDAKSYGRDFDFTKPFFQQFHELLLAVPQPSLFTEYLADENSDYTNYAGNSKNCYLIAHADYNRDCYYGYGVKECESCCDIYNLVKCELCYECIDCYGCYDLKFSQDCLNCANSAFLRDCVGCKNCIGCQNLRQKEYWIWNQPASRDEYERLIKLLTSHAEVSQITKRFAAFSASQPHRYLHMLRTERSLGDQLVNCKNVRYSFEISDAEDCKYCRQLKLGSKDCMDVHQFGSKAELLYECSICGQDGFRLRFCSGCYDGVSDLTYCSGCLTSHDLFGCVNLRRSEYCIFNKQYSKDDYQQLSARIIDHMKGTAEWGEFFPPQLSPFAYNETRAQEFYPLTKEQALAQGLTWINEEPSKLGGIPSSTVADSIGAIGDDIAKQLLLCEASSAPYRITPQELKLYRQIGVPLPRRSPDQRFEDRMRLKNPRRLWQRACHACQQQIMSSFAPERAERVYCEQCYEQVVQ